MEVQFDIPKQRSSIIKVIGVGGGGSNAVNYMYNRGVENVDFIVCNTDSKALEQSIVPNKIQLGPSLTQGLGAGADPEQGRKATLESLEEIKKILEVNTKMAFITVGMGGGTGTGGAPIIAQICKELGILTVGIVTTPFSFEGPRRSAQAQAGINELKPNVDTLLVISNDKLRECYGNWKFSEAFGKADNILATAAICITDIIGSKGHINVDFADVCTVMRNGGVAILGKAEAEGPNRAQMAIEAAITSPLLNDNEIKGAKNVLMNINCNVGDDEATMEEIETISGYVMMQAGEETNIILGMGFDPSLDKKIGITLIATGFDTRDPFVKAKEEAKPAKAKQEKVNLVLDINNSSPTVANGFDKASELPISRLPEPMAPKIERRFLQDETLSEPFIGGSTIPTLPEDHLFDSTEEIMKPLDLSPEITSPVVPRSTGYQGVYSEQPKQDLPSEKMFLETNLENGQLPALPNKPAQIYSSFPEQNGVQGYSKVEFLNESDDIFSQKPGNNGPLPNNPGTGPTGSGSSKPKSAEEMVREMEKARKASELAKFDYDKLNTQPAYVRKFFMNSESRANTPGNTHAFDKYEEEQKKYSASSVHNYAMEGEKGITNFEQTFLEKNGHSRKPD